MEKKIKKISDKIITLSLRKSANTTSCGCIYQPKAPKALNNYKREKNDK